MDTLKISKLHELILNLNDDLNDPKIVAGWLAFLTVPHDEHIVDTLQSKMKLPRLQAVVDLMCDIHAAVNGEDEDE